MTSNQQMQPWDDQQMATDLLAAIRGLPRLPLLHACENATTTPAAYVMFMAAGPDTAASMAARFTPMVSRGVTPWYVGSAVENGRSRLQRYKKSLELLPGLQVSDLRVAVLPCTSRASALFAEASLLDGPAAGVANRLGGFGSKTPGARRSTQKATALDSLFAPGRGWTKPPTAIDQIRANCQLIAALCAIDPAGPRWPPITAG